MNSCVKKQQAKKTLRQSNKAEKFTEGKEFYLHPERKYCQNLFAHSFYWTFCSRLNYKWKLSRRFQILIWLFLVRCYAWSLQMRHLPRLHSRLLIWFWYFDTWKFIINLPSGRNGIDNCTACLVYLFTAFALVTVYSGSGEIYEQFGSAS